MGIFVKRDFNQIKRSVSLSDPKAASFLGVASDGLPAMTPIKSLGIPAVLACVDLKSKDIAMLPRHLYERTADGQKKVVDHDQIFLVKTAPNDLLSAFDFWRILHVHKFLWGNGIAVKNMNRNGRAISYEILQPYEVDIYQDSTTGDITYTDTVNNKVYTPYEVIHLKGFSIDGVKGISPITLARIAFQKGYSLDQYSAHFYHNKTNLNGWIEVADWLEDDDQLDELRRGWERKYRGYGKSDVAVLQGGSKYHGITMSMADAQFIENQKFSLQEIAMIFNVPTSRLNVMDNTNYSNMEAIFRQYATFSLQHEVIQLEQELTLKTIRISERNRYYWKVEMKGLLRGDTQAQAEYIKTMWDRGIMTADEIRALDDMNPIEGGSRSMVPLNMIPADRVDEYINSIINKSTTKSKINGNERIKPAPSVFSENGN